MTYIPVGPMAEVSVLLGALTLNQSIDYPSLQPTPLAGERV
jgi:hypothetical protein